jgi:hypothetical protein
MLGHPPKAAARAERGPEIEINRGSFRGVASQFTSQFPIHPEGRTLALWK